MYPTGLLQTYWVFTWSIFLSQWLSLMPRTQYKNLMIKLYYVFFCRSSSMSYWNRLGYQSRTSCFKVSWMFCIYIDPYGDRLSQWFHLLPWMSLCCIWVKIFPILQLLCASLKYLLLCGWKSVSNATPRGLFDIFLCEYLKILHTILRWYSRGDHKC